MIKDPLSQSSGPTPQFPVKILYLVRHLFLIMKKSRIRNHNVQNPNTKSRPYQDPGDQLRQQFIKDRKKFISIINTEHSEYSPEQGIRKTDVTVKIPAFSGIIPPLPVIHPFQSFSRKPFHDCRHDHTAKKQKQRIVFQFPECQRHKYGRKSIDKTDRSGKNTTVDKLPVFSGCYCRFDQPSKKRIHKKQPQKLIS